MSFEQEDGFAMGNGSPAHHPTTLRSGASTVTLVDQLTPTSESPGSPFSPRSPKYHHKSSLKRNSSYGTLPAADKTEARVLVIYTGGTIGMMRNEKNGEWWECKWWCYFWWPRVTTIVTQWAMGGMRIVGNVEPHWVIRGIFTV